MLCLYARCPKKRVPVYNTLRVKATQHSMLYAELGDGEMLSKVIILNGRNGNGLAKCYTMLIFVSFRSICFRSCTCSFFSFKRFPLRHISRFIRLTHKNGIYVKNKVTYGFIHLSQTNAGPRKCYKKLTKDSFPHSFTGAI